MTGTEDFAGQPTPPLEPGIYEHYRGKRYEVVAVGKHTETGENLVVYKPLYESKVAFWMRPYDMFIESIEKDGQTVPRFRKIDA